jgi:pimeloyl-ACP methyl ester carboxylesterase
MIAEIAGQDLSYRDEGWGRAILFLHAFPLGLGMWDAQARGLGASCRVVRFDDRGFGGSPPKQGPLTMDAIADDAAALMDHLAIERAVLWGCSMGGYAALAFARRHASRLLALVLQDTRAGADTEEARQNRGALAERVLAKGPVAASDAFLGNLLGETTKRENPALLESVRTLILKNPATGIANALAGLGAREDSSRTLGEIRVPTLVLCGDEDVLTPPRESEALARAIAGSRLEIVPRAGHLSNMEQPDQVTRLAATFVGDVG